jgi:prepilin signal peptidase PulO-like enzyme (type II secretory pathway)
MQTNKLDFLYAPSFWSMFIGAIAVMFGPDGIPTGPEIYQGLLVLSGGFTAIYTLNKNVKRLAESPKNTPPMVDGEI